MHELSVCQALITQVEAVAEQHRAIEVYAIRVQIGPLAGIEPDLLEHAYLIARAGTLAQDARLVIDRLPIRVYCEGCGRESEATAISLVCTHCGDWHTRLVSGDEMLLASVEFATNNELTATKIGK